MTEERRMIRDAARDFTMKEVLPVANKLDPTGDIPMELRQKLADMGYFGITIPEKYGGLGLGVFEYCLICRAAGTRLDERRLASSRAPRRHGSSRRCRRGPRAELPAARSCAASSQCRRAVGARHRLGPGASISCRAVRDGDEWVLTGNKYWCTFADGADYITVFARTSPPPAAKRWHGHLSFLIEKPRGTCRRASHGNADSQDRLLRLEDLRTGASTACACRPSALIGKPRRGLLLLMAKGLERAAPTPRRARSVWPRARSKMR
jgi:alkylation response protein AidB-like acyl-CoA dehydrogenase